MIDVSIIIVNYNNTVLIKNCIASIVKQTRGITYEIIVSDNCSSDGVEELLQLPIKLVRNSGNVGFGTANNHGAAHASGQYILYLNPDTVLINNAIGLMVDFMRQHPEAGGCGANLLSSEMKPTHSFHRIRPSILREMDYACGRIFSRLVFGQNAEYNHTGKPLIVPCITGADLMVSREVNDNVGGFDERFFMYYEDADLCARICAGKHKLYSVPDAEIQHLEGCSYSLSLTREKHILLGRSTYFHIHYSRFYNYVADVWNIVTLAIAKMLYHLLRSPQEQKYSLRLQLYKELCHTPPSI